MDPRALKTALLAPIRAHARGRRFGAHALGRLANFYLTYYLNVDSNGPVSGEHAVLRRLSSFQFRTVFDVGAHSGGWTGVAMHYFSGASFHLFEPIPDLESALRRRFSDGHLVYVNNVALADRSGAAPFFYFPEEPEISSFNRTWAGPRAKQISIQVMTGDEYVSQAGIEQIDYLKIDAEGHDLFAIRGFRSMIERRRIRCIQFEYGEAAALARAHLTDFYDLLSPQYLIGKIFPDCVDFDHEVSSKERLVLGNNIGNYCAVLRDDLPIVAAVRG